jgi:Tol biopolymer transport system component
LPALVTTGQATSKETMMIGRMVGALALLAAFCAAAVPADATPPGGNGDIFYSGLVQGQGITGIWRVHPDGTGAQQLPLGANAVDPRVSPDGTRLLYSVFGQPTDFLANADGSDAHAVAAGGSWYPSGTQVVFWRAAHRRGYSVHLFRENLDGTGLKKLTGGRHRDLYAEVSPDGSQIAFQRDGMLVRMPAAGGTPVRIGSDVLPYGADWSPDSTKLVYACWNPVDPTVLCMINADGSGRHVVWQQDGAAANDPVWSPDGTQITFDVQAASNSSIWRVNADGSDPELVTAMPGEAVTPSWQPLVG